MGHGQERMSTDIRQQNRDQEDKKKAKGLMSDEVAEDIKINIFITANKRRKGKKL